MLRIFAGFRTLENSSPGICHTWVKGCAEWKGVPSGPRVNNARMNSARMNRVNSTPMNSLG
jgi:hypothetical protein